MPMPVEPYGPPAAPVVLAMSATERRAYIAGLTFDQIQDLAKQLDAEIAKQNVEMKRAIREGRERLCSDRLAVVPR